MSCEIRYCKSCRKETRHDIFKDGLVVGEKADRFERGFFAVATFGLSELISDTWRKCQVCDKKERV